MYCSEAVCMNQDVKLKYPAAAWNKVTGKWRKLHSEELHDLYCSPDISRVIKSRRMRWAGHVACMNGRGAYNVLITNYEERKPLERPRHRWGDNFKLDLKKLCWEGAGWTEFAQGMKDWLAIVKAVMNLQVSWNVGCFLTSWGIFKNSTAWS